MWHVGRRPRFEPVHTSLQLESCPVDWPLIGRTEEMRVAADALGGGADYAGVVIVGRAGVGKTRLAREAVAAAAGPGWCVFPVTATAAARGIPLGAFAQWMGHGGGQQVNVVVSVIDAMIAAAGDSRMLVTVDDAHLLDDVSAFVVHQLVRRRLATVITTVRASRSVPETLSALWKDGLLRRLDLQPLSRTQCDTLVESALGGPLSGAACQRMFDLTRGNVLFLRELVKQEMDAGRLTAEAGQWCWTGDMSASPTLVDLVELSIGSAPADVLEVVDLVTVAEPLELGCLTALADPAVVEEAERRELITVADSGMVRVVHPMYGEARRARIGTVRAARLRGRVVSALQQSIGAADPARLGLLLLESDLPGEPAVFLPGALAAFARLDLPLTRRLAEAAVNAGGGFEAKLLLALVLTRIGEADEADRVLDSLPAEQPPEVAWMPAILRATSALGARGLPAKAWQIVDDALRTTPAEFAQPLLAFRVALLALAARPEEAAAVADGVDRSQLSALPAAILATGLTIALGDLGRTEAAIEAATEGNRLAAESPQAAYQAVGLNLMYADALALAGLIPELDRLAGEVGRLWTNIPRLPTIAATGIGGMAALVRGDLPDAVRRLGEAIDKGESVNNWNAVNYLLSVAHTEAVARTADVDAALSAEARMQACRHPSWEFFDPARLRAMAWVAAARGRVTEAMALANEAAEAARSRGQWAREVMCLQTALGFGDRTGGPRLAELAGLVDGPRAALAARWSKALTAHDGDVLLEVSGELATLGDLLAAADAAAHAAVVFDKQGRRGARLTASERAARIMTDCGAVSPATRAVASPLPLSAREREIATLVGEGLSNKQIAEALTMSVRTVEGHIYRACNKLGLARRGELAAVISESTPRFA